MGELIGLLVEYAVTVLVALWSVLALSAFGAGRGHRARYD
jgi:hypothetical protein